MAENSKARLAALQAALAVVALVALLGLFFAGGIPKTQPKSAPKKLVLDARARVVTARRPRPGARAGSQGEPWIRTPSTSIDSSQRYVQGRLRIRSGSAFGDEVVISGDPDDLTRVEVVEPVGERAREPAALEVEVVVLDGADVAGDEQQVARRCRAGNRAGRRSRRLSILRVFA